MSSGITECIGNSCLKIYGSIISGISDAVAVKDSKVGVKDIKYNKIKHKKCHLT